MNTNSPFKKFTQQIEKIKDLNILEEKLLKIIEKELKKLYKENKLTLVNKKIYLDFKFINILSRSAEFTKNAYVANNLFKKLKKYRIISRKSILYPKNIKFISSNPLDRSFLLADMRIYDKTILLKSDFLRNKDISLDLKLYFYLRIFSLYKLKPNEIMLFNNKLFFELKENCSIIILIKNQQNQDLYRPIKILFLDDIAKNLYLSLENEQGFIFNKKSTYYEDELLKFLGKNSLNIFNIKICIEFEYQINNSPMQLSIKKSNKFPKITLKEINYLYPNVIPKNLLSIENKNEDIYFHKLCNNLNDEMELEEVDAIINNYVMLDFQRFEKLKKILTIPKNRSKEENYFLYWNKFLDKKPSNSLFLPIESFLRYLLRKTDPSIKDRNIRKIKFTTMRDYMSIAFKYIFNTILIQGEISEKTVFMINEKITNNEKLTIKSIKKYKRLANFFLIGFTEFNSLQKINSVMECRRSIVFEEEFNSFVKDIYQKDCNTYKFTLDMRNKSKIRSIFLILLYYTGLRKTELRTRLLKDLIQINKNTFTIDVNINGFKKTMKSTKERKLTLKTNNTKRRVRFEIKNQFHLKILTSYFEWLSKNNYKFLFPRISNSGHLLKHHVMYDRYINNLSKELQLFTKRYTPLHSLRHTFATNYFLKNFENSDSQFLLFELSNILGHADPTVTIENYLHLDFMQLKNLTL